MKIRLPGGYVTNSSSSSFIIAKDCLDDEQLLAIRKHSELGKRLGLKWAGEEWRIRENDYDITGYTSMDNFDISELFRIIGINDNDIEWSEYPFDLPDARTERKKNNKTWRDYARDIQEQEDLESLIEELSDED